MATKTFTKRSSAPAKDNKYYYSRINLFWASGYGMPNCTAYAYGRWMESQGITSCKLCLRNARRWFNNPEGDPYKRSQKPVVGAIMVWEGSAGHVAFVEEVKANGDVVASQSNYGGKNFEMVTYTKAKKYNDRHMTAFLGFIIPPVTFTVPAPKKTTTTATKTTTTTTSIPKTKSDLELACEVIDGKYGSGSTRVKNLGSRYDAVQKQVNFILGSKSKSNATMAKEVWQGKWGSGSVREKAINRSGHKYSTVQAIVNKG